MAKQKKMIDFNKFTGAKNPQKIAQTPFPVKGLANFVSQGSQIQI